MQLNEASAACYRRLPAAATRVAERGWRRWRGWSPASFPGHLQMMMLYSLVLPVTVALVWFCGCVPAMFAAFCLDTALATMSVVVIATSRRVVVEPFRSGQPSGRRSLVNRNDFIDRQWFRRMMTPVEYGGAYAPGRRQPGGLAASNAGEEFSSTRPGAVPALLAGACVPAFALPVLDQQCTNILPRCRVDGRVPP